MASKIKPERETGFGEVGTYNVSELEADKTVYPNGVRLKDGWRAPAPSERGIILARRKKGSRKIYIIAGAYRVKYYTERQEDFPDCAKVRVRVFDNLSDADAVIFHDAANIYNPDMGFTPAEQRNKLFAFRDELSPMIKLYPNWEPVSAGFPLAERIWYILGKSMKFFSVAIAINNHFTDYLLECLDNGWITTYTSRTILGWGKGKDLSRIIEFSDYIEKRKPKSKAEFVSLMKEFTRVDGGAEQLRIAQEAIRQACNYYVNVEMLNEEPDFAILSEIRGLLDRLEGNNNKELGATCPYLKGLLLIED